MIFSEHGTHRKNGDLFTHCLSSAEFIKLRKCRRPTDQREVTFLFATCILKSVSLPSFPCVPWSKPNQGASLLDTLPPVGLWVCDEAPVYPCSTKNFLHFVMFQKILQYIIDVSWGALYMYDRHNNDTVFFQQIVNDVRNQSDMVNRKVS